MENLLYRCSLFWFKRANYNGSLRTNCLFGLKIFLLFKFLVDKSIKYYLIDLLKFER